MRISKDGALSFVLLYVSSLQKYDWMRKKNLFLSFTFQGTEHSLQVVHWQTG